VAQNARAVATLLACRENGALICALSKDTYKGQLPTLARDATILALFLIETMSRGRTLSAALTHDVPGQIFIET